MTQKDWEYSAGKMGSGGMFLFSFPPETWKWERFGFVWEWATKQEWWPDFLSEYTTISADVMIWLVDPVRFPELIEDFLREKGEEENNG